MTAASVVVDVVDDGVRGRGAAGGASAWTWVTGFVSALLLPEGYPQSVSPDYLQYQVWDTAQAFCSSIMGTLSTYAVLKGVGVGDQEASVAAATYTHLLRNATGMLAGIWFAWYSSTDMDSSAKQWRLVSDVHGKFHEGHCWRRRRRNPCYTCSAPSQVQQH